jgi:ComF family protein
MGTYISQKIGFGDLKRTLFNLIWPEVCQACGVGLLTDENTICLRCLSTLPLPNLRLADQYPFSLSGLTGLPLVSVHSLMAFRKHGLAQRLVHKLKYENQPEIGVYLGRLLGQELLKLGFPDHPTMLVPVPLHPKRQRARGYNQAMMVAKGLAEVLCYEVLDAVLIRPQVTESQTSKSRGQRLINMQQAFEVPIGMKLDLPIENYHFLIVDDVLTTGATVGSCARVLFSAGADKISVLTLAIA